MNGFTIQELKEMYVHDLHNEEEQKILAEKFQEVVKKGFISGLSGLHHKKKDGSLVPIEVNASIVKINGNSFHLSIVRDLTHVERFEQKLKEDRKRLLSLLNGMPGFVFLRSTNYSISYTNQKFINLFGEPGSKPCYEVVMGLSAPCEECSTSKLFDSPKPGKWVWKRSENEIFQIYNYPFTDTDGSTRILQMGIDITETSKVHQALKESEKKHRTILEMTSEGYWEIDSKNKTAAVNDALYEMLGFSRDEIISKSPLEFVDEKSAPVFRDQISVTSQARPGIYEVSLKKKDASLVPTIFSGTTIMNDQGVTKGYFAFITLISSLKKAEEELRMAKEMAEEATKSKDKFVSLVAHDLRGPMGTFLNLLKILKDNSVSGEERDKVLEMLTDSVHKMNNLCSELLSMNRIQSGKIAPNLRFISVDELVRPIIEEYRARARGKGITLINNIIGKSLVYADEMLLRQVIQNFISNSIKFCSQGDTVEVGLFEDKPHVITVSDNGPGISKELRENLFRYDTQTTTCGSEGETGTGLGLPISQDIMKAHGGTIRVESDEGRGCMFFLELPCVRPSILLVDDEKIFRFEQKQELKMISRDIDILEAENGSEALEILKRRLPHVIITDINMPDINGFELLHHLKSDPRTRTIPVILVSAETDVKIRDKAFRSGAVDFVQKPLNPDEFNPRVKRFF